MSTRNRIVYINDQVEGKVALSTSVNSVDDLSVPNAHRRFVFNGIDSRIQINRHVSGQVNRMQGGCKFITTVKVPTPEFNYAKVDVYQPIFSCIRPDGSRRMEVGVVSLATGDNEYEKVIYISYRNNEDFAYVKHGARHLSGVVSLAVDWVDNASIKVLINGKPEIDEAISDCAYQPWEYEADEVTLKPGEVTFLGANPIRKTYFEGEMWSFSEQSYMTTDRTAEMIRFLALNLPEPFFMYPAFYDNDLMTTLVLSDRNFVATYNDPLFSEPVTARVDYDVNAFGIGYVEFEFSKDNISTGFGVCTNAGSLAEGLYSPTVNVQDSIYISASTGAIKVVKDGSIVKEMQTGRPVAVEERVGVRTSLTGTKLTSVKFFREGVEVGEVSDLDIPPALRFDAAVATTFVGGSIRLNSGERVFSYGTTTDAVVTRQPAIAERESILFDGEKIKKSYFPFTKSSPGYDEYNNKLYDPTAAGVTTNQAAFNAGSGASATFAGNTFEVVWPFEGKDFISYFLPAASVISFCFKPDAADLIGDVPLVRLQDRAGGDTVKVHLVSGELTVSVDIGANVFTVAALDFPISAGQAVACGVHLEKVAGGDRDYRVGVWLDGDRLVSQAFTFAGGMSHLASVGAESKAVVGGLQGRISTLLLARKDGEGPFYRGGDLDADWRFKRIQGGAVSGGGGVVTGTISSLLPSITGGTGITACCVADNGDVYIGGLFTEIDGVSNFNHIAKLPLGDTVWQKVPSSATLSGAVGFGVSGYAINDLLVTNAGHLYIAGSLGTDSPTFNVAARIDLNTGAGGWIKHSDGVLRGIGHGLTKHPNGTDVVITGAFRYTNAGGKKYNYVVKAIPTSYKVERYPSGGLTGVPSSAKAMLKCSVFGADGTLYVGGSYAENSGEPTPANSLAAVWRLDPDNLWRIYPGMTDTLGDDDSAYSLTCVNALCMVGSVLYAGGLFSGNYPSVLNGIAMKDTSTPGGWLPVSNGTDNGFAVPINNPPYDDPEVNSIVMLVDGSIMIGGKFSPHASQPAGSHGLMRFVPGDNEFTAEWGGLTTGDGYNHMYVEKLAVCAAYSVNPDVIITGFFNSIGAVSTPDGCASYGP